VAQERQPDRRRQRATYRLLDVKVSTPARIGVVANSAGSETSAGACWSSPRADFASYTDAVLSDNPIHYYPLDENKRHGGAGPGLARHQ